MSAENHIVSLQLDNAQFEKNSAQSLKTLNELQTAMGMERSEEGLQKLNKRFKKLDTAKVEKQFTGMTASISASTVAMATAVSNFTNKMVNAIENTIRRLTIDPIKLGFDEYETKMNAIATIMANTEKELTAAGMNQEERLSTVNQYLAELNEYADKTIYNFAQMTRNIGTFTAAGVELDVAVDSIKGIANLAALSGSSSQQASTAMYQLSQAIASGKVKLQDWNSVVNAGMGGQMFQDALKQTAANMGTVIDESISFRDSLSSGWLTSEILTETLTQFAGGYTKAELLAKGYTEEQADEWLKLAETAEAAATNVKTLTQLFSVMQESVQSGWAETWEIIIGDSTEAVEFLTMISDAFSDLMGPIAEARNEMLRLWESSGGYKALVDGVEHLIGLFRAIYDPIKKAWEAIFPPMAGDELAAITIRITNLIKTIEIGLIDNAEKITEVFKGLFSIVNIGVKALQTLFHIGRIGLTYLLSGFKSLFKLFGMDLDSGADALISISQFFQDFSSKLKPDVIAKNIVTAIDSMLRSIYEFGDAIAGDFLRGIADSFSWIIDIVKDFGKLLIGSLKKILGLESGSSESMEEMGRMTSRGLARGMLSGIDETEDDVVETYGDLLIKIKDTIWSRLKSFGKWATEKFHEITAGIFKPGKEGEKNVDRWGKRLADALAEAIDFIFGIVGRLIDILVTALWAVITTLWDAIKDLLGDLGEWLDEKIPELWEKFTDINFADLLLSIADTITKTISGLFNAIQSWINEQFDNFVAIGEERGWGVNKVVDNLAEALNKMATIVGQTFSLMYDTVETIFDRLADHSMGLVGSMTDEAQDEGKKRTLIESIVAIYREALEAIEPWIEKIKEKWASLVGFMNKHFGFIIEPIKELYASMFDEDGSLDLLKVLEVVREVIAIFVDFTVGYLASGAARLLHSWASFNSAMSKGIKSLANSIRSLANSMTAENYGEAIKSIGIAVLAIAAAILIISVIEQEDLNKALKVLAVIAVVLAVMMIVISKFETVAPRFSNGVRIAFPASVGVAAIVAAIAAMIGSIVMLIIVLAFIPESKTDFIFKTLGLVLGLIAGLILTVSVMALLLSKQDKDSRQVGVRINALAKIMSAIAAMMFIMVAAIVVIGIAMDKMGDRFYVALAAVTAMMIYVIGIMALIVLIGQSVDTSKLKNIDGIMKAIAVMLLAMVAVMVIVALMDPSVVGQVVLTMAVLLVLILAMTAVVWALSKIKADKLTGVSIALMAIGAVMIMLAIAMKTISDIGDNLLASLASVAVMVVLVAVLGLLMFALSKMNAKGLALAVVVLFAIVGVILILTNVVETLANIPLGKLVAGMVALAMLGFVIGAIATMLIIVGALSAIPGIGQGASLGIAAVAVGILAIAMAFFVMANALVALSNINFQNIVDGLVAFSESIFAVFVAVLALALMSPLMILAAVGLLALGVGLLFFGNGASVVIHAVQAMLQTMMMLHLIRPILDDVIDSIVEFLQKLADQAPAMVEALLVLIFNVLDTLATHIPEIIRKLGELVMNVFLGVWDVIVGWISGIGSWLADKFGWLLKLFGLEVATDVDLQINTTYTDTDAVEDTINENKELQAAKAQQEAEEAAKNTDAVDKNTGVLDKFTGMFTGGNGENGEGNFLDNVMDGVGGFDTDELLGGSTGLDNITNLNGDDILAGAAGENGFEIGNNLTGGVTSGIESEATEMSDAAYYATYDAQKTIESFRYSFRSTGNRLMDAVIDGIVENIGDDDTISKLQAGIDRMIKESFDGANLSDNAEREIRSYVSDQIITTMIDDMGSTNSIARIEYAAKTLGKAAADAFNDAYEDGKDNVTPDLPPGVEPVSVTPFSRQINDEIHTVNEEFESIKAPTITPVLDLSLVGQGLDRIKAMLKNYGLDGAINGNSLSHAVNSRLDTAIASGQNGSNITNYYNTMNQNNTSPQALNNKTIYRETKSMFSQMVAAQERGKR